jgi:hypothetical protein
MDINAMLIRLQEIAWRDVAVIPFGWPIVGDVLRIARLVIYVDVPIEIWAVEAADCDDEYEIAADVASELAQTPLRRGENLERSEVWEKRIIGAFGSGSKALREVREDIPCYDVEGRMHQERNLRRAIVGEADDGSRLTIRIDDEQIGGLVLSLEVRI